MVNFYRKLCVFKCLAYTFFLLENSWIESTCEMQDSFISHFRLTINANNMFCSCLKENAANKFWMTRGNNHKVKLTFRRANQTLQLFSTHQFAVTFNCLKQKKVALVLLLVVELSHVVKSVLNSMAWEVDTQWFLAKNFLKTFNCTLLTCYSNLGFRLR